MKKNIPFNLSVFVLFFVFSGNSFLGQIVKSQNASFLKTDSVSCSPTLSSGQPNIVSKAYSCSGACNGTFEIFLYDPDSTNSVYAPYTIRVDNSSWDTLAWRCVVLPNAPGGLCYLFFYLSKNTMCPGPHTYELKDAGGCVISGVFSTDVINYIPQLGISTQGLPQLNEEIRPVCYTNVGSNSLDTPFTQAYPIDFPTITPNPSNALNVANPGELFRFKVLNRNRTFTSRPLVSSSAKIVSNSPFLEITDSTSTLNNLAYNNYAWTFNEFEVKIKPETPAGSTLYFDYIVTEAGALQYKSNCLAIPVTAYTFCPPLSTICQDTPIVSPFVDDDMNPDSQGNDDNIVDPGETIEFFPSLNVNVDFRFKRFPAYAKLSNVSNNPYVDIWENRQGVNDVISNTYWLNNNITASDFVFDYASNAASNDLELGLIVTGGFRLMDWKLPSCTASVNCIYDTLPSVIRYNVPCKFNASSVSGVSGLSDFAELMVYPNPSENILNIKYPFGKYSGIKIYNITGELVLETLPKESIDVAQLPKGLYVLRLEGKEINMSKRFVLK